eukprot:gene20438-22453_t
MVVDVNIRTLEAMEKTLDAIKRIEEKVQAVAAIEENTRAEPSAMAPFKKNKIREENIVHVFARISVVTVGDIDPVKQKFKCEFYLSLRWKDKSEELFKKFERGDQIKWGEEFWEPAIYFVDLENIEKYERRETVQKEGEVTFHYHIKGTFDIKMDIQYFPFDFQRFVITMTSHWDISEIDFHLDKGGKIEDQENNVQSENDAENKGQQNNNQNKNGAKNKGQQNNNQNKNGAKNGKKKTDDQKWNGTEDGLTRNNIRTWNFAAQNEWRIQNYVLSEKTFTKKEYCKEGSMSTSPNIYPLYKIKMYARRKYGFFLYNIALTMALITALTFTNFTVGADVPGDRIQISLTLLLTSVALKYVVNGYIPQTPTPTVLGSYILASMVFQFVMAVQSGISGLVHSYKPHALKMFEWWKQKEQVKEEQEKEEQEKEEQEKEEQEKEEQVKEEQVKEEQEKKEQEKEEQEKEEQEKEEQEKEEQVKEEQEKKEQEKEEQEKEEQEKEEQEKEEQVKEEQEKKEQEKEEQVKEEQEKEEQVKEEQEKKEQEKKEQVKEEQEKEEQEKEEQEKEEQVKEEQEKKEQEQKEQVKEEQEKEEQEKEEQEKEEQEKEEQEKEEQEKKEQEQKETFV